MRKIFVLLTGLLLPAVAFPQFTGSGTFSDPWSGGTLTGDMTWSAGKVYVSGDLTIGTADTQGHLTIDPGVSVVFTTAGADLIVTGLGRISAAGTAGNGILFTADHDNDSNYGESGETRGHIVFTSMNSAADPSIFQYCTLEYGDVRTGSNTTSYGGGFFIHGFNKVTIDNCTIQKNKATHGGAILLFSGSSPVISNTLISENSAGTSGGGIYSAARNNLLIFNCILYLNSSGGGGGGGIYIDGSDNTRIINSLFVSNTTSSPSRGANVQSYTPGTTIRFRFINSVIWGANNSIGYFGTSTPLATDFNYCAIQNPAIPALTFTSCIDLNSDNNNAAGPNFKATDGSDWSIIFISPMRDTGTDSYPGVTIPATDIAGNTRVGPTDIGAYETLYNRWKSDAGSTDWNTASNWHGGVPGSDNDIVIPGDAVNYPVGTPAPDVAIGDGRYLILESGARATTGTLTNNGSLQLKDGPSGFASLIMTSYSRGSTGSEEIDLFLTGGGTEENEDYKWHYISSPVASMSTNIFTAVTPDLAQYVESRPTLSLRQGWVAYDGYVYSTGQMNGPTFSNLSTGTNGKGYNYFDYYDHLFTFSGLFNTSTVTAPLDFSGSLTLHGFNLLGNPFISGLDWNYIINDAGFPANTSKGVYFTRDNIQCSYINGVGVPSDVDGIIPPMQGFFTKTYATGNSIVLAAEARTHDDIHPRYKGTAKDAIPLVRLSIEGEDLNDETVVRFDYNAKTGWDNDFDAAKLFYSDTRTYIYTTGGDEKYSINGLPFPETMYEIPLVINVTTGGTHKLSVIQMQGLDNYKVRLLDRQYLIVRNLATDPVYTFTSGEGVLADRFLLMISDISYDTESNPDTEEQITVYQSGEMINIIAAGQSWEGVTGDIMLTDMSGKRIRTVTGAGFSSGSVVQVPAPQQKGIYFVEIRAGVLRHTAKVVVR
ncbi:MAG: right-handed parallel beta-helix repeat-containing protein [Bacteroidales bacterium]|jgi:predicted outer membrane repeat protein|nr:right-handed parallel beta-helix repeat-containing protein [Bacteroidales bacterium]